MVRRLVVAAVAMMVATSAAAVGAQPRFQASAPEVITTFDTLVEGVEAARDGNVYVSEPLTGDIVRVTPDGSQTTLATLPAGNLETALGPLGLESDQFGNVYAAVTVFGPDTGVYVIAPDGTVTRLAGSENIPWPNGLEITPDGTVWVADTTGAVWRIERGGTAEEWLRDPLLEGDGSLGFGFELGANGIVVHHRAVHVTNTEGASIVRIPIEPDGSAGHAAPLVVDNALFGADGMVADAFGNLYVANLAQSTILRVADGSIEEIAGPSEGLDAPSSVAFGWGADRDTLYYVQFLTAGSPNLLASIDTNVPGAH